MIEGMGEEVIRIPLTEIRQLAALPADVEIVASLRSPERRGEGWTAGGEGAPPPCLWLHIRHRYCIRTPPGGVLPWTEFEVFLSRYWSLAAREGREVIGFESDP